MQEEDNSQKAAELYGEIAEPYAKAFAEPSDHLDDFLEVINPRGKVLDVGCGVGVDANFLQSKGFEVIGIDLSKGMLAYKRNRGFFKKTK
jgi:SAM-dependent methyltransferase